MGLIIMADERCRACGCDDLHACQPGGCCWVDPKAAGDGGPLCSACFGKAPDVLWTLRKIENLVRRLGAKADTCRQTARLARQLKTRMLFKS